MSENYKQIMQRKVMEIEYKRGYAAAIADAAKVAEGESYHPSFQKDEAMRIANRIKALLSKGAAK